MKRYLFLLLLSACIHPATQKSDLLRVDKARGSELPPPRIDYEESNLLIDSTGRFFYYQQPYQGFHLDNEDYGMPLFIDLRPAAIVEVPPQQLVEFLDLNITRHDSSDLYRGRRHTRLAIGLAKDSMHNPLFPKLKAFFAEANMLYGIRRFTEEETVVLKYKKSDMLYDPHEISWDSSKTHFFTLKPFQWPLHS